MLSFKDELSIANGGRRVAMMSEQKEKIQSDKERLRILQSELAFYKKLTKRQEKLIKKLLNAISDSKEQLHQIARHG